MNLSIATCPGAGKREPASHQANHSTLPALQNARCCNHSRCCSLHEICASGLLHEPVHCNMPRSATPESATLCHANARVRLHSAGSVPACSSTSSCIALPPVSSGLAAVQPGLPALGSPLSPCPNSFSYVQIGKGVGTHICDWAFSYLLDWAIFPM
jgi:hypothetical protein